MAAAGAPRRSSLYSELDLKIGQIFEELKAALAKKEIENIKMTFSKLIAEIQLIETEIKIIKKELQDMILRELPKDSFTNAGISDAIATQYRSLLETHLKKPRTFSLSAFLGSDTRRDSEPEGGVGGPAP